MRNETKMLVTHATNVIAAALAQNELFAVFVTKSITNPEDECIVVHDDNMNAWVVTVEPLQLP